MNGIKIIIASILVAIQLSSFSQKKDLLRIPVIGNSIVDFIPAGYDTLQTSKGDLNNDGRIDFILVVEYRNKDNLDKRGETQRILLVLLKQKMGYRLKGKSTEAVMCRDCGGLYGDPFVGVSISNGLLEVQHYAGSAWRWSEKRTFKFLDKGFYLIRSTSDYYWNINDCNGNGIGDAGRKYRDVNWVTGNQEIVERDEDCRLIKHKKNKIKKKPLIRLDTFKYEKYKD